MTVTQSSNFNTTLYYNTVNRQGGQVQVESYSLATDLNIPSGTGSSSTSSDPTRAISGNFFNDYAKSTGTLAAGATLDLNFASLTHQEITGGTSSKVFAHVNAFVFETAATGLNDLVTIRATGDDPFTNLFYGGSGGPSGVPVKPYAPFSHIDYYGTSVSGNNRLAHAQNTSSTGIDYKYLAIGFTGSYT